MKSLIDVDKLGLNLEESLSVILDLIGNNKLLPCPFLAPQWVDEFTRCYLEPYEDDDYAPHIVNVYVEFRKFLYENEGLPAPGTHLYDLAFDKSYERYVEESENDFHQLRNLIDVIGGFNDWYLMPEHIKQYARLYYENSTSIVPFESVVDVMYAKMALEDENFDAYSRVINLNIVHGRHDDMYEIKVVLMGLFAPTEEWAAAALSVDPKDLLEGLVNLSGTQPYYVVTQSDFNHTIGLLIQFSRDINCDTIVQALKNDINTNWRGISLGEALIANMHHCGKTFGLNKLYPKVQTLYENISAYNEQFK